MNQENQIRPCELNICYLDVPYLEKNTCKEMGGKWDFVNKKWYVPSSLDPTPFVAKWGSAPMEIKYTIEYMPKGEHQRSSTQNFTNNIIEPVKVSILQKLSDKSDKSWYAYLAKKAHDQRSIKLVNVWQFCSDNSDKSWTDYVWSKDSIWKYCSEKKSWTKTIDCA